MDRSRWAGGIILLIALTLTTSAAVIFLWPDKDQSSSPVPSPTALALQISTATPLPTVPPPQPTPTIDWERPTAAADEIATALIVPQINVPSGAVARYMNPLTVQSSRVRSGIITYSVQKGDNLESIAGRFSLDTSTIIWSNDRFYVNAMRVGLQLTILPVNGVYHHVVDPQTIKSIADEYAVDPYAIIDSEFNSLFGAAPDMVLPSGLYVVVPGGTGSTEPIYWDPGITMTSSSSSSSGTGVNAGTDFASFAVGDPGSCGKQAVVGGTPPYSPPLHSHYSITQNFSWVHGGIDLATPVGTGVFAAGGGTVIFSGWSTWGYGYSVVIAHGGTLSIYGHLNGALVSCGQHVTAGQGIAVSGSSGNSSGPHLHFEIRGASGAPVNPWDYQSF